ncbi:hypothetical protein BD779DRAFT_1437618 [Infundibulicybe gibba]|nr:hypothetical protein BD779DRAFT_1437618 [Infundibulicybe gibba]
MYAVSALLDAVVESIEPNEHRRKRPRLAARDPHWYPWPNKLACTIDILLHLPRSVFSKRQLDIFLWLLMVNDVDDIPSKYAIQNQEKKLQGICGVRTLEYEGALGHRYCVNSLGDLLAQEMANPRVREHLRFYPEDNGKTVAEFYQASGWRELDDPIRLTPMARIGGQDFYLYEPCLLKDGRVCMPFEWFKRGGGLIANVWTLRAGAGGSGWIVEEYNRVEVPEDQFLVSFTLWNSTPSTGHLPPVWSILGSLLEATNVQLSPWTRTNPQHGNQWRSKAGGSRVYSFPIWLYCDDTSGNVSKKWNKHNSFLFTAAGLPRHHLHQEYNIHFLSTSNIAPLLEMLDGIVDQLEEAWAEGIWAWDCIHKEPVLIIPWVVALLGDNPMQSELSCHIGLAGKFFCRNCDVKGFDVGDIPALQSDDEATSEVGLQTGHDTTKHRSRKKLETLDEMVQRVKRFVRKGQPRQKVQTIQNLHDIFASSQIIGNQRRIKTKKTETGVKDNFLEHFLTQLSTAYLKFKTKHQQTDALESATSNLPDDVFSPVWHIWGLNPHSDTPVEILHVVLLGFVKYFWRDVVQNQIKKPSSQWEALVTRLNSVDVSGLGISKLAGETLVNYAGSLTGRDFRAVAQVAPFVLYNLVSQHCYDAWVVLSNLIPLVWQTVIPNIDEHLKQLEIAIHEFLTCTARWTPRWFNKPKFHLLLHILAHIRRFGPAVLFATEGFESYNAVIRGKSVHSNRMAPSRDIALAFAQGNRVRHLLSGGSMLLRPETLPHGPDAQKPAPDVPDKNSLIDGGKAGLRYPIGPGPLSLIARPNTITSYLGLDPKTNIPDLFPDSLRNITHHERATQPTFRKCVSTNLLNGDVCRTGFWVFANLDALNSTVTSSKIYQVVEILQHINSPNYQQSLPDALLLQSGKILEIVGPYQMPQISLLENTYTLVGLESILCTVNVQHRCASHRCEMTDATFVQQERHATSITKATVSHSNPSDLVLNTAQMRDAIHFTGLRRNISPSNIDDAIMEGAIKEIDARKSAARATSINTGAAATTRGRGTGRTTGRTKARGRVVN